MKRIGIIGLGRVGTAMAYILPKLGYSVIGYTRNPDSRRSELRYLILEDELSSLLAKTDILLITTPDSVIGQIVQQIKLLEFKEIKGILHMSGSLTSQIFGDLEDMGVAFGSLHPLQSFTTVGQALANLPGSYFTYEGHGALLDWVANLVASLEGKLKVLPSDTNKAIYHAGACIVSNHLVGLMALGMECLKIAGFFEQEAQEALLPLMKGTLDNLERLPLDKVLTGPIARGDLGVVEDHLNILAEQLPDIVPSYQTLAFLLAGMAFKWGKISGEQFAYLNRMLKGSVI